MKKQFFLSLLLAGSISASAFASSDTFSTEQKKQIEQLVHDYLVNNPNVLVEASQALQRKQQSEMESLQKQAIDSIRNQVDSVFFNQQDPVLGNPKGTVTLVEFYDYQCGHCREMTSTITDAIKNNPQLRVVFKPFPIFGEASELASKAVLAAAKQGKFAAMHQALMKATDFSQDNLLHTAKKLGLELNKFKTDLASQAVSQEIAATVALAKQLKIYFTPVLIAANANAKPKDMQIIFVPGQVNEKVLSQMLAEVKQG
ncbi:MAG: 27 kDa outer membrane protein [Gammaproteobacteria bacterium]|nr:27 kDa outer membrane protein [Gammaproteobacteria bacterium]